MKNYMTIVPGSEKSVEDKVLLLIEVYFYLRLAFMILLSIICIIICVELNNVADEIQHYIFHMTNGSCCNLYH